MYLPSVSQVVCDGGDCAEVLDIEEATEAYTTAAKGLKPILAAEGWTYVKNRPNRHLCDNCCKEVDRVIH